MKGVITTILFTSFIILSQNTANAQAYQNAFGFRGGVCWGPTYKFFVNEQYSAELLATFRKQGMQFTALMQSHKPAFWQYSDHLVFYYGIGGHIGYTRWMKREDVPGTNGNYYHVIPRSSPVIGADAQFALEYQFYNIPLALTIEYKPFIDIFGRPFIDIVLFDFGMTARFTF